MVQLTCVAWGYHVSSDKAAGRLSTAYRPKGSTMCKQENLKWVTTTMSVTEGSNSDFHQSADLNIGSFSQTSAANEDLIGTY